MNIVLLSTDLMTASQIENAARELGAAVHAASTGEEALHQAEATSAEVVVLDLSCPAADPAAVAPPLQDLTPAPRIVAFGPHVHREKLAAAESAGCDRVFTRGQFFSGIARALVGTE